MWRLLCVLEDIYIWRWRMKGTVHLVHIHLNWRISILSAKLLISNIYAKIFAMFTVEPVKLLRICCCVVVHTWGVTRSRSHNTLSAAHWVSTVHLASCVPITAHPLQTSQQTSHYWAHTNSRVTSVTVSDLPCSLHANVFCTIYSHTDIGPNTARVPLRVWRHFNE